MEKLSVSSFLQNGHPYHLYVYDDVAGVPQGTILKDAYEIIPRVKIFKNKYQNSYSIFADLFRYKLLLEHGGYWVDTDVVCLKPFEFETDYLFSSVLERRKFMHIKRGSHIANWFIKAPVGSEIMEYCYHEAAKQEPDKLSWGETGPILLTAAVEKFGMRKYVAPHGMFFPTYAWQWRQLINASFKARWKWKTFGPTSFAVHLYHEMWRRNHVDKNAPFPRNSIYERLKLRYLTDT